jgi:hypothetical protein
VRTRIPLTPVDADATLMFGSIDSPLVAELCKGEATRSRQCGSGACAVDAAGGD